jgi:hypothetical protein
MTLVQVTVIEEVLLKVLSTASGIWLHGYIILMAYTSDAELVDRELFHEILTMPGSVIYQ